MIFIYNTTGAKIGLETETVSVDGTDVKTINLKVGDNRQRIMTVDNDVEESVSLASLNKNFEELRHNPFKTDLSAKGKKCVYATEDDTVEVVMKDFFVNDTEDKNRQLPRAVVYVVTKPGGEAYVDPRSLYAPCVTVEHETFAVHKLVMRYGKWSSLKIRVFVAVKDGKKMKKLQLRGMRLSTDKTNPRYNYITNTLQESDMTDAEYEDIKNGVAPKFGHRSMEETPEDLAAQKREKNANKRKKKKYKNNANPTKSNDTFGGNASRNGGYTSHGKGNNRSNNRANYNNRGR